MHILFIDANVMFSAAYRIEAKINQFWELPAIKLITSRYAIEEAQRNLKEKWQIEHLEKLIAKMRIINSFDIAVIPQEVELRAKDQPILAAAIMAKAQFLITGDYKDFGRYYGQVIAGVTIIPPADYLNLYK